MMPIPLTDILPPKVRKYVYAALLLASIIFGAWQASEGDWTEFIGALLVALGFGTAASNTPPSDG